MNKTITLMLSDINALELTNIETRTSNIVKRDYLDKSVNVIHVIHNNKELLIPKDNIIFIHIEHIKEDEEEIAFIPSY